MPLTIGSLFSGIGGLELGLERAGLGPVRWQCEIDPFARRVLAKHWPDATRFTDITTLENPPYVDVICGGFPCQDISLAGLGAGLDGARSGLWREYIRIVRQVRPRYVVVENVAALLVRGLDRVLGDLAASGYDAEWDCIPASAVGAPHQRDRLFIVATDADRDRRGQQERAQLDGGAAQDPADRDSRGRHADGLRDEVAHTLRAGLPLSRDAGEACPSAGGILPWSTTDRSGWWATEPALGRVAHGVPARVDRLRTLGNAVVPQVAEVIGRLIVAAEVACP